ncbi:MAG TPA: hypothetical protein VNQ73_07345 [Ilumatobacter sp.]|nr:hypothetical protein [Ilumatobacter sp.]
MSSATGQTSYASMDSADLLRAVRNGDRDAYGVLYVRHLAYATTVARRISRRHAEDYVAEAFRRVLHAIDNGAGPTENFASYLAATIRTVAAASRGDELHQSIDESERLLPPVSDDDADVDPRVLSAFLTLPDHWRDALWCADVEGLPPRKAARVLNLPSSNAFSALAKRARASLRSAYLGLAIDDVCDDAVKAKLRNTVGGSRTFDDRAAQEHLAVCPHCRAVADRVAIVSGRKVAGALAPAVVAYLGFARAIPRPRLTHALFGTSGATGTTGAAGVTGATGAAVAGAVALAVAIPVIAVGLTRDADDAVATPGTVATVVDARPTTGLPASSVPAEPVAEVIQAVTPTGSAPATAGDSPKASAPATNQPTAPGPPSAPQNSGDTVTPRPVIVAPAPTTTAVVDTAPATTTTHPPVAILVPPTTTTTSATSVVEPVETATTAAVVEPEATTTTTTTTTSVVTPLVSTTTSTTTSTTSSTTTTSTTTTTVPAPAASPGTLTVSYNGLVDDGGTLMRVSVVSIGNPTGAAGQLTFAADSVDIRWTRNLTCTPSGCSTVGAVAPQRVTAVIRTPAAGALTVTLADGAGNVVATVHIPAA